MWGLRISPHGKSTCCSVEMAFPELTENYTPIFQEIKKVNGMNVLRIHLAIAEISAEKLRLP